MDPIQQMAFGGLQPSPLITKLAAILGSVGKIEKKGFNNHFQYKFVREADLVEAVREKLATESIIITSSVKRTEVVEMSKVVNKTGEVLLQKVGLLYVEYMFRDGKSGETFTVEGVGEIEQDGGKGIYKALTGAMKYMLMKNFLIDTGDDPEMDGKKDVQPKASNQPKPEYNKANDKEFPYTKAQANLITKLWGELTKPEQKQIEDIMAAKKIDSKKFTKKQASFVIDEITKIKQGRKASAAPIKSANPPPPHIPMAPLAEEIESWADEMRSKNTVNEVLEVWRRVKIIPMQVNQLKYLDQVKFDRLAQINHQ